jgi:hypothetical protein
MFDRNTSDNGKDRGDFGHYVTTKVTGVRIRHLPKKVELIRDYGRSLRSGFPLQFLASLHFTVGFPLQSLTQKQPAHKRVPSLFVGLSAPADADKETSCLLPKLLTVVSPQNNRAQTQFSDNGMRGNKTVK